MSLANIYIGREEKNDIVYKDNTVSRKHAKLKFLGNNQFRLEDLNSTNGTLVNGEKISSPITVTFRDEVQFGAQLLEWNEVKKLIENKPTSDKPATPLRSKKSVNALPYLLLGAVVMVLFFLFRPTNDDEGNSKEPQESASLDTTNIEPEDTSSLQPVDTISSTFEDGKEVDKTAKKVENEDEGSFLYKQKNDPLEYSISCLRSKSALNELIGLGAEMEDGFILFSSDEIGVEEEVKAGKEVKRSVEKEYAFSNDHSIQQRINNIFNRLINALGEPSINYKFYILKSDEINAFTAGGLIFITTGIIDFAENDDELACIIGHEIYHNELGHINKLIRKEKAAQNWLGDFADWGLIANSIMGASFNQENEVYCDLYGSDLAIKAGYDGMAAARFWSRMDQQNNAVDKMLSTHPFSDERLECIEEHLERNYFFSKNK